MTAVACSRCGKRVSNLVTVEGGLPLIVRAWVECPECIEKHANEDDAVLARILRRFIAGAPSNYVRAVRDGLTLDGEVQIDAAEKALIERLQIEESKR